MVLTVTLKNDVARFVQELARQRGVPETEIAEEAIAAYATRAVREEGLRHAEASIRDNSELLRRLA